MSNILIVAAHPDDEVISVGGTIIKHIESGDKVFVLIMCAPRSGENFEMIACNDILKTNKLYNMGYEDQELDTVNFKDLVSNVTTLIHKNNIDTVYTHTGKDLNRDHYIMSEVVYVATRPLPGSSVKRVFAWSTPGGEYKETFKANYFIDTYLTNTLKLKALENYMSEMRSYPHPRSIKNIDDLASIYGTQNGIMKAEAFEVIRIIK